MIQDINKPLPLLEQRQGQAHGGLAPECLNSIVAARLLEDKGWYMDPKELKGLEIAARANIAFVDGYWLVPSQSKPGLFYRVTIEPPFCECPNFQDTQKPCKHVIAARFSVQRSGGQSAPVIDTSCVKRKPGKPRDHAGDNRAARIEKPPRTGIAARLVQ